MKKIIIDSLDEEILYECIHGLDVYYYNTNKTRNFYCSLTVNYGGNVLKYKKNNSIIDVIPGSAHFLEHKIMNYTSKPDAYELINSVGSLANAFTDYLCTNYNILGSERIIDNIKLILDLVFFPKITKSNVENEKGIINEEIDMNSDDPIMSLYETLFNNIFENSFLKTPILGTHKSIKKISDKSLMNIYTDFYNKENMFLCISGNYNIDKVNEFLYEYLKNIKNRKKKIRIINKKEKERILINYSEIKGNNRIPKVSFGIKTLKNKFKFVNDLDLYYYLIILLSTYYDNSSLIEKYKKHGILINVNYEVTNSSDNVIIVLTFTTESSNDCINRIKKDIKNLKIKESDFERKKKVLLNNLIMGFENIEEIDYFINRQILTYKKINNNLYDIIKNLNYEICKKVEKTINYDNISIVRQSKY